MCNVNNIVKFKRRYYKVVATENHLFDDSVVCYIHKCSVDGVLAVKGKNNVRVVDSRYLLSSG